MVDNNAALEEIREYEEENNVPIMTEDGIKFGTPSMPPYLLIRGEDGKILGALI